MKRAVTIFAVVFLLAQAAAVTWPLATVINDPDTRVFGLPLPFAWGAGWVAATFVVMTAVWLADRSESARGD